MRLPKLLTTAAIVLALLLAVQLYAQDIPDRWMPEPPKPPKIPIQPPVREPPIRPPIRAPVELKGYIYAVIVDPVDPLHMPGRTEYYFHTVDGKIYRLDLSRAKLYLCSPRGLIDYVGTGKLVIVKGYLMCEIVPLNNIYGYHLLIAVEVRDPAYPRCR
jgi:hypothetical protein